MRNLVSHDTLLRNHDPVDWSKIAAKTARAVKLGLIKDNAEASMMMLQAGFSDYSEQNILNYITGGANMPALPQVWLALFTTAPTGDSGAGAVEVNGTGYTRVQVSGTLTTNGTTSSSSNILHFASAPPAWIVVGMTVRDVTAGSSGNIAASSRVTVVGGTAGANTITMNNNAAGGGVGNGDVLSFDAFSAATPSVGNEPSTTPGSTVNGTAIISFAQAGGNWGTVTSWGLYDGSAGGNLLMWDYLGNFSWLPFTCTNASPGVFTSTAHGYSNGDPVVVTTKYGGTLPTTGGSFAGVLTVAGVTTDTFNVGVNTTSTGDGQVRKIVQQSIPANVTASFAAGQVTLSLA